MSETITPSGDGLYSTFKIYPTSPTTHWDKVLTAEDSKYAGNDLAFLRKDLYTFINPTTRGYAISSIDLRFRKIGNNASVWYKYFLYTNSTEYLGPQTSFQLGGWGWRTVNLATNPVTSAPWTLAELDALQAGFQVFDSGIPSGGYFDAFEIILNWGAAVPRLGGAAEVLVKTGFI